MFKILAMVAVLGASPFDYVPTKPDVAIAAADEAAIDKLADAFFSKLKAGQYKEAYDGAFSSPLMKKRSLELEQVASQTEAAFKMFGPVKDWEPFASQMPSKNFVRRFYVVRTENLPLFFTAEFYHVDGRWMILNITFVDSFKNLQ